MDNDIIALMDRSEVEQAQAARDYFEEKAQVAKIHLEEFKKRREYIEYKFKLSGTGNAIKKAKAEMIRYAGLYAFAEKQFRELEEKEIKSLLEELPKINVDDKKDPF